MLGELILTTTVEALRREQGPEVRARPWSQTVAWFQGLKSWSSSFYVNWSGLAGVVWHFYIPVSRDTALMDQWMC